MATASTEGMTPGPQMPQKYSRVGPNYRKWGEQRGWIYYYPTDSYYVNPKDVQSQYENEGIIKKPPSMTEQLAPVAGLTTGTALATEAGKGLLATGKGATAIGATTLANGSKVVIMSDGTTKAIGAGALGGGGVGGGGAATATSAGALTEGGAALESGMAGLEGLGGAGGIGGGGATGAATGTTAAPTILGNAGQMGLGPLAAVGAGTYLGGREAYQVLKGEGKDWGDADPTEKFGRVTLGIATGGLSELGRGALKHEGTKEAQKRRWGSLSEGAQGLMAANHPDGDTGKWTEGKYAGESWSFDKALDRAKENPDEFRGVYGNLSFDGQGGNEYLSLSADQQREFVRQNIAAGNYDSKKGDVIVKDHDKARQIMESIKNPKPAEATPSAAEEEQKKKQGLLGA